MSRNSWTDDEEEKAKEEEPEDENSKGQQNQPQVQGSAKKDAKTVDEDSSRGDSDDEFE